MYVVLDREKAGTGSAEPTVACTDRMYWCSNCGATKGVQNPQWPVQTGCTGAETPVQQRAYRTHSGLYRPDVLVLKLRCNKGCREPTVACTDRMYWCSNCGQQMVHRTHSDLHRPDVLVPNLQCAYIDTPTAPSSKGGPILKQAHFWDRILSRLKPGMTVLGGSAAI
jgi:DNA-directed RNA polymerase subunit RPC12/RpoP